MYKIAAIALLALLPICAGLNCYVCSSGLTGCNDPFSASNSNVTTVSTSANIYCVKNAATSSMVTRFGSPSCSATPFVFGVGTACCQTDLCNGASGNYKVSGLVILSLFTLLFKYK